MTSRHPLPLVGRFAAVILATALLAPAAWAVDIARDGEPAATIVTHGHDDAAAALRDYVQKITGAELPLSADGEGVTGHTIVLRTVEAVPGASDAKTAEQAYRITATDDRLTLTAGSALGLDYAVYGLLQDHLGVSFLTPEYEHIPQRPTLAVEPMDEVQEPAFTHRSLFLFHWGRSDAQEAYARKNRHYPASGDPVASGHTYQKYKWSQNCPLDPEYHQQLADLLKAEFAKRDADDPPLAVGQRDWGIVFGCDGEACPRCGPVLEKEKTYAALMVMMFNAALELTAEEYPDHDIITFAYFNTLPAPETVKPHENLWINIVSSDLSGTAGGDQLNSIRHSPGNRAYKESIQSWPKIAPGRVLMWHWGANWGASRYAFPNLYPVIDDIRLWHESGVNGAQWQIQNSAPHLGHLKNWVWMQLTWNPDQDADALIQRFVEGYYGPKAAPFLMEYLRTVERLREEAAYWPSTVRWSAYRFMMRQKLLVPGVRRELDALMEKAVAAAETDEPIYLAHTAEARARTVDEPIIDGARTATGFDRVVDPRDGSAWYVAGGRPDVPARIERVEATIRSHAAQSSPAERELAYLYQQAGHRIHELQSGKLTLEAVPAMQGRLIGLSHADAEPGLFAGHGYEDVPRVRDTHWEATDLGSSSLATSAFLNDDVYAFRKRGDLLRTVEPLDSGDGFHIQRQVRWSRLEPKKDGIKFSSRWNLLLHEPAAAVVRVVGAGIDETFTGDELANLTQRTKLDIAKDAEGPLVVELDRGDGVLVRIETTAEGWAGVHFLPVHAGEEGSPGQDWQGDPMIAANAAAGSAQLSAYRWHGPKFWPWDKDAFPVDPRPHVRVHLDAQKSPYTERGDVVDLPAQRVTVRSDAPTRTAPESQAADVDEPAQAHDPVTLEIIGDGLAINPRDGSEMVYVPAGEFLRGSDDGGPEERPERKIHLDGYWISRTEVTIGQYRKFEQATDREASKIDITKFPYRTKQPREDEGVYPILLNWFDAQQYAAWAGGALPSEAQWEKAARGTDGRAYPWGEQWDSDKVARLPWSQRALHYALTHPIGGTPEGASPYGALDMAGNVYEWVGDWYAAGYYEVSPDKNPKGPATGVAKVIRGGDTAHAYKAQRTSYRQPLPPHVTNWLPVGFRLVVRADAEGRPLD